MFKKGPIQDYGKEERGEESQDDGQIQRRITTKYNFRIWKSSIVSAVRKTAFRVLQLGLMRDLRVSWRWENSGSHGAALATSRRTKRRVPHGH